MMSMGTGFEVVVVLRNHCIQTAARQEYQQLLSVCLREDEPGEEVTEKLSLLRDFLERTDFQRLRSQRPELSGMSEVRVAIRRAPPQGFECDVLREEPRD